MNEIRDLEKDFLKKDTADFKTGDTVRVSVKIKEGDKTRLQAFEGTVISRKGSGIKETFIVRHISYGEGVERVFQLNSPLIDSISVVKKGKVKRARLYYLRKKVGKGTAIEEERAAETGRDALLGEKGVS
ncbi:MAG: 50S ribosomal protein L19 [Candidatus Omnitrophota bacterium]